MNSLAPSIAGAARRHRAIRRRASRGLCVLAASAWLAVAAPGLSTVVLASWQEHGQAAPSEPQAATHPPATAEHAAEGEHGGGHEAESPWAMVARLFNFAVLAGGLVYFLRSPAVEFLKNRSAQIRSELAKAAEMRDAAAAQMSSIEQRMASLPAEIDALKRRGAEEIAVEEVRIREMAQQERERMLTQAKREIEVQLRLAERELTRRAGELAVDVATVRVRQTITDADQARLVQRYLQQVRN